MSASRRNGRRVSHRPRLRRRLLAVASDGFVLRAAAVQSRGGAVVVDRMAESRHSDPGAALAEALGQLRESGRLPRKAIVSTAEAVPAVIELPVSPAAPRPATEMQQLIRWEMEPYMAQRQAATRIGAVLVSRGHMTHEQVRAVLEEVDRRGQGDGAAGAAPRPAGPRFGEAAVQMSLAEREQVDECLRIQRALRDADDEPVCGWAAQGNGAAPADGGPDRWLVCAVRDSVRRRWAQTFRAQGLRLEGIYPLVGCAGAAVNGEVGPDACVVEAHPWAVGCARVKEGRVQSLRIRAASDGPPSAEECLDLAGGQPDRVWLCGHGVGMESLRRDLGERLGDAACPVPVEVADADLPAERKLSLGTLAGAAAHALGLSPSNRAVCVAARDPRPSVHRRPATAGRSAS